MLLEFLKPRLGFVAKLANPRFGAVLQLGMVLIFPRSRGVPKSFALAADLDFATGHFRQEGAPPPLADQLVDVGDQVDRQDDVCPAG